jgi:hypothetical protein
MHEINFIDKSFNAEAAGTYYLSIQANFNGLSYCISDESTNSYILFRKHRFDQVILASDFIEKISTVLNTDETLKLNFRRVRFLGYSRQSTLIPEEYFDVGSMKEYLGFNHAGEIDQSIFNNYISSPGLYNIFALPDELVSIITLHFKRVEFMNQTTPFLRHIANMPEAFSKSVVYLGLHSDFFDIACTGNGKLLLCNTFQYANETDLLYYIVFVYNKIGFDTLTIPLMLSGESGSKLSYFEVLRQYIPNTEYDEPACIPSLAFGLKQLSTSRFLNLLNLQQCVSSAESTAAGK